MKNILFYGDSNTWGFNPETGNRYPLEVRWTTICASLLGEEFHCIPAGMNGRTTVFDDPLKGCRNGLSAIDYELQTHKPLDLAVVMLGTNDLKYTDAEGSRNGMEEVLRDILTANERFSLSYPVFPDGARILLVSPILIEGNQWFGPLVDAAGESRKYAGLYQELAERLNREQQKQNAQQEQNAQQKPNAEGPVYFLDAAMAASPSPVDGVHLAAEGHAALGKAIAEAVRQIFL